MLGTTTVGAGEPAQRSLFEDARRPAREAIDEAQNDREKLDAILQAHEEARPKLIAKAREVARELAMAHEHRETSSPRVLAAMRARGWLGPIGEIPEPNPRWMGAVFGARRGWVLMRYVPEGHHRRPVPVWRLP